MGGPWEEDVMHFDANIFAQLSTDGVALSGRKDPALPVRSFQTRYAFYVCVDCASFAMVRKQHKNERTYFHAENCTLRQCVRWSFSARFRRRTARLCFFPFQRRHFCETSTTASLARWRLPTVQGVPRQWPTVRTNPIYPEVRFSRG